MIRENFVRRINISEFRKINLCTDFKQVVEAKALCAVE